MADLTDKELAALRPNMRLDRASDTILRRQLVALLDEVERHRNMSPEEMMLVSEHAAELAADRLAAPSMQLSAGDVATMRAVRTTVAIEATRHSEQGGYISQVALIDRILDAHRSRS